jgi:hypothetical protein
LIIQTSPASISPALIAPVHHVRAALVIKAGVMSCGAMANRAIESSLEHVLCKPEFAEALCRCAQRGGASFVRQDVVSVADVFCRFLQVSLRERLQDLARQSGGALSLELHDWLDHGLQQLVG